MNRDTVAASTWHRSARQDGLPGMCCLTLEHRVSTQASSMKAKDQEKIVQQNMFMCSDRHLVGDEVRSSIRFDDRHNG